MDFVELENRLKDLENKFNSIIMVGKVTVIEGGAVRVKINDNTTSLLPVLFPNTQDNKYFQMPDVGEQVLCIFLPFGIEQGFVLGTFYSEVDTPPVNSPEKTHIKFKDGTVIEYDREGHVLNIDVKGNKNINVTQDINITASGNINIKSDSNILIDGNGEVFITTDNNIKIGRGRGAFGFITEDSPCPFTGGKHTGGAPHIRAQYP